MFIAENGIVKVDVPKIDSLPMDGLLGTPDSLAYKVHELEKHFHNAEQWFGRAAGDGFLDQNSILSWQITANAVAGTYGTEVQISDGTEIEGGDPEKKFDFHRIFIETVNVNDQNYKIQFWYGTDVFGTATLLTEFLFRAAAASERSSPLNLMSPRIACNNKLWVRCMCASGGKTLNFLIGVHNYIK